MWTERTVLKYFLLTFLMGSKFPLFSLLVSLHPYHLICYFCFRWKCSKLLIVWEVFRYCQSYDWRQPSMLCNWMLPAASGCTASITGVFGGEFLRKGIYLSLLLLLLRFPLEKIFPSPMKSRCPVWTFKFSLNAKQHVQLWSRFTSDFNVVFLLSFYLNVKSLTLV